MASRHREAAPGTMTAEAGSRTAGGREAPPAERLLAAAEELFGQHSYHRTTVADICAKAGMATGSFYSYFESKAEIFAAVVRAINADLRRAMRQALQHTGGGQRARERASFRVYFDMLSERPWMDRIVRESEFISPGLFREYYENLTRGYARGVRAAQLAGDVDARYDPEVVAFAYTGIGNFVGMRWADWTAGGRVPGDVLDDVLELLARGLAAQDNPQPGGLLAPRCGQPCGTPRARYVRSWRPLTTPPGGARRRPRAPSPAAAGPAPPARRPAARTTARPAAARPAPPRGTHPSPPT